MALMKFRLLALLFMIAIAGTAGAEGSADTLILVAKRQVRDQLYGSTIIVVKPLSEDRHVGFIINKPTQLTLGKLFPNHQPSQKVTDPVYLGGPFNSQVIFALVQRPDSPGGRSVRLGPDLYLAVDSSVVDRIIESEPQHARFFAGMVLWKPGELADEVKRGLWYTIDSRTELVMRSRIEGLWAELAGRSERKVTTIWPLAGGVLALVMQCGLLAREPRSQVLDVLLRQLVGEALHDAVLARPRFVVRERPHQVVVILPGQHRLVRRRRLAAVGAVACRANLGGLRLAGSGVTARLRRARHRQCQQDEQQPHLPAAP